MAKPIPGSDQDSSGRLATGRARTESLAFRIIKDVAYLAPYQPEKLDLYLPSRNPGDLRSPAVVWMHGNHHDKGDSRELNVCGTLARAGYVCASINYGTWTNEEYGPAAEACNRRNLANAKTAVRFLRVHAAEYHLDPLRIAAFGGSAGGYLALMMGATNGDAGFDPSEPYPGASSAVCAIGDFYGDYYPSLKEQITSKYPPILIAQGKSDPAVDFRLSAELAQVFAAKGVPNEFILMEGVGHAFDLTTWNKKLLPQDLRPIVLAFLNRYLRSPLHSIP